jgi:hypothetical protein
MPARKRNLQQDRAARAWHEAAHAVIAAKHFGLDVRSMEILDKHPRLGGQTEYLPAIEYAADASPLVKQGARCADMVVALAGPAIEQRLGFKDGSGDDHDLVWRTAYAHSLAVDQRDTVQSVKQLRDLASELVSDYYDDIKKLATRLYVYGRLERPQIQQILWE